MFRFLSQFVRLGCPIAIPLLYCCEFAGGSVGAAASMLFSALCGILVCLALITAAFFVPFWIMGYVLLTYIILLLLIPNI